LGLPAVAVVALGGCAIYYAIMAILRRPGDFQAWRYVVPCLAALLTVMILLVFRRNVFRSVRKLGEQVRRMIDSQRVGMVMTEECEELAGLTDPLNDLLAWLRKQMEEVRGECRELHIQARIASAEKHNTEAMIFSISDAVIVTNRFDELILANEAAEELLGFKLASSLRKSIDRILGDPTLVRLIRETRVHGRSFTRKVVEHAIDQKGSPRTFNITLSCVVTPGEEVTGVVAVLHDVTREKEIARMKSDFVSNVSHELKTPLASVKAYIEMLIDGEAQDEKTRREFYEIISSETERLHRLIENILNLSRIESGVVKVVREATNLSGVVKQVLEVALPQARQKNIQLVERLSPVFYQVEADHDMIYQAVMNLVSNAIKYTHEGGTVTVAVRADENRNVALCEVVDTGAGIPADQIPHIFDKFYRVKANEKMAKGTGLGLTLAKHIVETVHDGKLTVESEVGKGSTFRIELPVLR
jgi:two-component system phosphate regulon sensor histidine kinase PhoR